MNRLSILCLLAIALPLAALASDPADRVPIGPTHFERTRSGWRLSAPSTVEFEVDGPIRVEAWPVDSKTTAPLWTVEAEGADTHLISDAQGELLRIAGKDYSGDWTPDHLYELATGRKLFDYHEKYLIVRIPKTTLRRFVYSYQPGGWETLPWVEGKYARSVVYYGPGPMTDSLLVYSADRFFHQDSDTWLATATRDGHDEHELSIESAAGVNDPNLFNSFFVVVEWRRMRNGVSEMAETVRFEIPIEHDRFAPEHATLPDGFELRRFDR